MGKKGKKSKKQLEEELARQQEEQRRQEEQERLSKVEDDARQAQAERLAAELDAKNRVEEYERLDDESVPVESMKGSRKQNLTYENQKLQDRVDWQKFISCNARPNVAFESEITTYLSTVQEEKLSKMEQALAKCRESEEIVDDLVEQYCKAREEGDLARQEWCSSYGKAIRDLEVQKLDDATAHLLQHIEEQEANSRSEVQLTWGSKDDKIKVGFWGHLQSKGFRAKVIDHHKIQVVLELPKSIALQSMGHCIGVRSLYTNYDNVRQPGERENPVMSVGGMIRVDLLSIPPFTKKVKGWTIRPIPPPGQELTRLPYPNTEHATTTSGALQPCKIEYKVPSHVLVRKNPTVSWWDPNSNTWSTDNIGEVHWETESRKISFFSQRLAAFAITQERHLDLPYKDWGLRPISSSEAELTLHAARYEVKFHITEAGLRLLGPELPEFQTLMWVPTCEGANLDDPNQREPLIVSPATLLWRLKECGMNLMPEDYDAEFLSGYAPKNPETEARAYSDLSEIAGSFDIASSKHNMTLDPNQALIRIRENAHFEEYDPLDPDSETDYKAVIFFPNKSCFVDSLESTHTSAMTANHCTHGSFYLCVDKAPQGSFTNTSEMLQRFEVTCGNVRFVEAVRQTMQLCRLLSFG